MKNNPFYKINVWYSITINPEDRNQYFGTPNRYVNFMRWIRGELFEIFPLPMVYVGNVELSEPKNLTLGMGPRLHFHGMFKFKDNAQIFKFLLMGLNRAARGGHVDIDTVGNVPTWISYCRKHEMVMPKDACLSNHYTVQDHYLLNTLHSYESPEGTAQAGGSDGLVKEGVVDVSLGNDPSVTKNLIRRKRSKQVSIIDWVAPSDAVLIKSILRK